VRRRRFIHETNFPTASPSLKTTTRRANKRLSTNKLISSNSHIQTFSQRRSSRRSQMNNNSLTQRVLDQRDAERTLSHLPSAEELIHSSNSTSGREILKLKLLESGYPTLELKSEILKNATTKPFSPPPQEGEIESYQFEDQTPPPSPYHKPTVRVSSLVDDHQLGFYEDNGEDQFYEFGLENDVEGDNLPMDVGLESTSLTSTSTTSHPLGLQDHPSNNQKIYAGLINKFSAQYRNSRNSSSSLHPKYRIAMLKGFRKESDSVTKAYN